MVKQKSPAASSKSGLAEVIPHETLLGLEQERRWLLKQIRRKRSELDNFITQMRDLASELFQRSSGSLSEMRVLDAEIHALFDEIFKKRKLGKRSRRQVEQVYRSLQMQGIISFNSNGDNFFREDESDFDPAEADPFSAGFGPQDGESSGPEPDDGAADDSAAASDASAGRDRAFRQTFLRLASVYHPDRAEDETAQARNTEIMKEINRAYKSGDFARLLELEQQDAELAETVSSAESDVERECQRLARENVQLQEQYESIKHELRELRNNTQEGVMVKTYRKAAKEGVDLVGELVEEAAVEIKAMEEIRDFVRDFRDRKITIQEFVEGPSPPSPEEMIAAMEEMLGVKVHFDPDIF